jgi:hypothetical protein
LLTPTPLPKTQLTFSDATAAGNDATKSYGYYALACNDAGCSAPTYEVYVPFAATSLSATPSSGKINLKWTDKSANESGFQIFKKAGTCSNGGAWALLTGVAANTMSYADSAVSAGQSYVYRVRAYYKAPAPPYTTGYSAYSGCAAATP